VKFKPKRGYRRRNGHRQELTRIEVTFVRLTPRSSDTAAVVAAPGAAEPVAADATVEAGNGT